MLNVDTFLHLVRALFPRWSFFDRVSYDLDLDIKIRNADQWRRIAFTHPRSMFGLFINPGINLMLAQQSVVEQFVQDLHERTEEIEEQTSYKMLVSLLRSRAGAPEFQFKLTARRACEVLPMYASSWLNVAAP